jgi:hypothetical protein
MNKKLRKKLIWLAPLAIVALTAFIALGGEIVHQLWNWLLPPLFGLRQITFWQGLGILVLCRILFGGFGFHNSDRPRERHRMSDRLEAMTPEEREQIRQRMRSRWGLGPPTSESK